ncbi:MAG: NUDIX hydrolase [Deltaproteobacteria bacterium]
MIKKWKVVKSEELDSNRVFATRKDTSVSPVTGKEHEFFIIDAPDWVNVVAVTPGEEIVLIRQYRHGIRSETIEIPGGIVDPGESPVEAAKRELIEETGYTSDEWIKIGEVVPNPAIQNNTCHTFLALSSRKIEEPSFDATEFIETFTAPVSEMSRLVSGGQIDHSLVVAAFHWFYLYNNS